MCAGRRSFEPSVTEPTYLHRPKVSEGNGSLREQGMVTGAGWVGEEKGGVIFTSPPTTTLFLSQDSPVVAAEKAGWRMEMQHRERRTRHSTKLKARFYYTGATDT